MSNSHPGNSPAVRLQRDYKAHLRAIQISQNNIFAYCEGKNHDRFFYSELIDGIERSNEIKYEILRVEEVAGLSGKKGVKDLHNAFRKQKKLDAEFKGKKYCCIFFCDKDIDDLKRTKLRSKHFLYTEMYDVEAHILREANLQRAIAAGLGIDSAKIPSIYNNPLDWIEAKANSWKEWLVLCVFSGVEGVDCGCGFGRVSSINPGHVGPTDFSTYNSIKGTLQAQSGLSVSEFEKKFSKVEEKIELLVQARQLHLIFKGKWLPLILREEIRNKFNGQVSGIDQTPQRVMSAALTTIDFKNQWATNFQTKIKNVMKSLV